MRHPIDLAGDAGSEPVPIALALVQPGIIWSCWNENDALVLDHVEPPREAPFRWVHLDLCDRRSVRWVTQEAGLPADAAALFVEIDTRPQGQWQNDALVLILPDLERDFDAIETGRIGALRVAYRPGLIVTGRHRPLKTPDTLRAQLAESGPLDGGAALELIFAALGDLVGERTQVILAEQLALEDQILADEGMPDTRLLVGMRRLSARLHRLTAGMRTAIHRLEGDVTLPPDLSALIGWQGARLGALDRDIIAVQSQLRLLRDELDLQAGQRTNENVYLLSIVTALFVPATLVTGFFGMNTGGLPFAHGAGGTLLAAIAGVACSGITWLALRRMGLIRR
ncbi:CorA family divalent cation transporter [Sphingomonas sp. BIUV-7]|uniref:CorA family divalent cation transporter n=1 Tax=Sphingomonas natans TaxID=3063330 RepID=A0ABT8Y918_9SPHN|nr:CorA family divalent cation transporter [Sphingomonas sp. BIUV-7]MDO6414827.1 CorA family divalent cation transporter [Sphingomonas sp. BIUV-7]